MPFIALVGRPNVGKSTLFNRIIGEQMSVVDDEAGTTRDRIYAKTDWNGATFTMVDTGGIEPLEMLRDKSVPALAENSKDFILEIREQAEAAVNDADVLVFVVDSQLGLTAADESVAAIIRKLVGMRQRAGKRVPPIMVAASKAETKDAQSNSMEFFKLGLGDVYPVSGKIGDGIGDLLDAVVKALPTPGEEEAPDESIKIALIGRPNVGKSSMFNALIGEARVIVSDVAGTTRDAIDTKLSFTENIDGNDVTTQITLIDTAGIRKRGTIEPGVEKFSVLRAFRAIDRADVTFLLIDAKDGVTSQDEHIAGFVLEANKGAVLVINKWDLIESQEKVERLVKEIPGFGMLTEKMFNALEAARARFNFMSYVPIMFTSAATGFRVDKLLPMASRVFEARNTRLSTAEVNRILRDANDKHAPPTHGGRRLKIYFGHQVGINPPTFVFQCNDTKLAHFTYRRFLENKLREEFGFVGTPLRIVMKGHGEKDS